MEAIRQFIRIPASHKVLIDIPQYIESEQLSTCYMQLYIIWAYY